MSERLFSDPEFEAMRVISTTLAPLDPVARYRVAEWQAAVSQYRLGQATRSLVWLLATSINVGYLRGNRDL